MLKRLLTLCAAALLAACAGDPAGSARDGLRVAIEGDAVAVTNLDEQPVYYRIVNPEALALWAPCTAPEDCPRIAPGQTVRIPFAEIGLYQPDSTEAELYWWRFLRVGERYVTTGEGRLQIRLR